MAAVISHATQQYWWFNITIKDKCKTWLTFRSDGFTMIYKSLTWSLTWYSLSLMTVWSLSHWSEWSLDWLNVISGHTIKSDCEPLQKVETQMRFLIFTYLSYLIHLPSYLVPWNSLLSFLREPSDDFTSFSERYRVPECGLVSICMGIDKN